MPLAALTLQQPPSGAAWLAATPKVLRWRMEICLWFSFSCLAWPCLAVEETESGWGLLARPSPPRAGGCMGSAPIAGCRELQGQDLFPPSPSSWDPWWP